MHDSDGLVRVAAGRALGAIEPAEIESRVLPCLLAALDSPDSQVRGAALKGLSALGTRAGPALERVRACRVDSDEWVRGRALEAESAIQAEVTPGPAR
ncbi:MAG: HEAT repeat domain-containing protein [Planctomycetes bacterium]|nr:HEAT repeat domain-containing protein [Planctomycetota bacterium]